MNRLPFWLMVNFKPALLRTPWTCSSTLVVLDMSSFLMCPARRRHDRGCFLLAIPQEGDLAARPYPGAVEQPVDVAGLIDGVSVERDDHVAAFQAGSGRGRPVVRRVNEYRAGALSPTVALLVGEDTAVDASADRRTLHRALAGLAHFVVHPDCGLDGD